MGDYWITGSIESEVAFLRVKAFPNQDQFNSVIRIIILALCLACAGKRGGK